MNKRIYWIVGITAIAGFVLLLTGIFLRNLPLLNGPTGPKKESNQVGVTKTATPGDQDSLAQQAANDYARRVQEAANLHDTNTKNLQPAQALDMRGVDQREKLEAKRIAVRNFIASNAEWKKLLENQKEIWRENLTRFGVPLEKLDAELERMSDPVPDRQRLVRIAQLDQEIGVKMLGALDYLDANWGGWNSNPQHGQIQFSERGALQQFNLFIEAIDEATRKRQELQNPDPGKP